MTSAALIVAAGMSSRMGDFKPLLNIGSISIAQRVCAMRNTGQPRCSIRCGSACVT